MSVIACSRFWKDIGLEQAVHVSLSLTSAWLTFAVADTASAVLVVPTIANVNTHVV